MTPGARYWIIAFVVCIAAYAVTGSGLIALWVTFFTCLFVRGDA